MGNAGLADAMSFWLVAKSKLESFLDKVPKSNIILCVGLVLMVVYKQLGVKKTGTERRRKETECLDFCSPIEPLSTFDWKATEPMRLRPYKPKYHLTMALENLDPSELIPMDKTYKDRIMYRRELLREHRDVVLGARSEDTDPRVRAAVGELYQFVVNYLATRYPTMFQTFEAHFDMGNTTMLRNLVTGEVLPMQLSEARPVTSALEALAKMVDEEMLVLLPEEKKKPDSETQATGKKRRRKAVGENNDGTENKQSTTTPELGDTKYILEAYQTCFPSGFDTRKKLGKRLADIHLPVPGYKDKLETGMDRYFEKLETGNFVKRVNWTITTGADLFSPFGQIHASEGEQLKPLTLDELDVDDTYLRCERQTLYRLPTSGAIVFSFHTYRYPIQQIKEEGSGEELASAIDGFASGSIPRIGDYKRTPAWGEAVKAYLRS